MSTADKWQRFKELPDDLQDRLLTLPALLADEGVLLAARIQRHRLAAPAPGGIAEGETGSMVLKRESVTERLRELDTVVSELSQYEGVSAAELRADLSQRWVIKRGLIASKIPSPNKERHSQSALYAIA